MTDGPSGRRPGKRGGGRDGDGADIRFYGRRKGHTLRDGPRQRLAERLPQLTIDISQPPPADLRTLFPRPVVDVHLEIGFGTGEHIVWQAGQHPDIGYIGAEPFLNGLSRFVAQADDAGVDNISIHPEDGRPLLDWLPSASIGRAYVLYPDPWPKRRHLVAPLHQRREFGAVGPRFAAGSRAAGGNRYWRLRPQLAVGGVPAREFPLARQQRRGLAAEIALVAGNAL